jgi:hypothetical protein
MTMTQTTKTSRQTMLAVEPALKAEVQAVCPGWHPEFRSPDHRGRAKLVERPEMGSFGQKAGLR